MAKYLLTDENARACHEGAMTFDAFARDSRDEWLATARWLLRRWVVPLCVEERDVVQELLTGAWLAFGKFDPKRGVALRAYVRFAALHRAMRWMHQQRNAKRRDGHARGRFELPMPEGLDPGTEATQEHQALLAAAAKWLAPEELAAAEGVVEHGSIEAWAWTVLGSQVLRERFGVGSYRAALNLGMEAVAKLAVAV